MFSTAADVLARSLAAGGVRQVLDPSVLIDGPASVRAVVVFFLTVLFGGAVIYRYGSRLDAAVDASTANPLLSVVYGLIAYGLVVFFTVYAYTQVARLGVAPTALTLVASVVLGTLLFALGGLGFVVVGAWVTETLGVRDPWLGLLGVGLVGAVALLVLPTVLGLLVWVAIAAAGVGGPTRKWMHADAADVHG